jgi:hypothetical protein
MRRVVVTLAILAATVLFSTAAAQQDAPLCVVSNGNETANLSALPVSVYPSLSVVGAAGITNATLYMSWCKTLEGVRELNQTGPICGGWLPSQLSAALVDGTTGACLVGFTAVSGPAMSASATTIAFQLWSATQLALGQISVTCDASKHTAIQSVVSNDPADTYTFAFTSSAACMVGGAAPMPKMHPIGFQPNKRGPGHRFVRN